MEITEKKVDSELKYHGVIVDVYLDHASLIDGKIVKREVVDHPGGVGIIPVDSDENCYMVRQFRYPTNQMLLEIPAGKLERGEDHYDCAVRELSEETGFTCDNLSYLGYFYTSPGFSNEVLHLYLATGLHEGEAHPDEGEFLNLEKIPLKDLVKDIMSGEIIDAKTVIGILKVNNLLHYN